MNYSKMTKIIDHCDQSKTKIAGVHPYYIEVKSDTRYYKYNAQINIPSKNNLCYINLFRME